MRPLFRWLAVISALGFLGLYVLQAQQNAQKEQSAAELKEAERKKLPAMAPGSKALAPDTSGRVFAPGSKSGSVAPTPKSTVVAPSSKMMIMPGSKRGEVRVPIGQVQVTPTPLVTPTPATSPTPATTPAPTVTPTPGPLK